MKMNAYKRDDCLRSVGISYRYCDLEVSDRHARKRNDYDYVLIKDNLERFKTVNTSTYVAESEQFTHGAKDANVTTNSLYDHVLKDEEVSSKLKAHWLTENAGVNTRISRQDNVDQSVQKRNPVDGINGEGISDISGKKAKRRAVCFSYEETDTAKMVSPLVTRTGSKFAVTVQKTPPAVRGKLVGDRNLTIEADKLVI
ncbi:uncharacterized protein LOC127863656 [Dreissena polymorpha]|uniref:uncharacterized protein LOC127863656 n=1 Tax=Dreissena polymorpha TaxID=45954 RepID=UPI0022647D19|nr:uncharacterized protein LOC127863656 [Dreissena polymorpha]